MPEDHALAKLLREKRDAKAKADRGEDTPPPEEKKPTQKAKADDETPPPADTPSAEARAEAAEARARNLERDMHLKDALSQIPFVGGGRKLLPAIIEHVEIIDGALHYVDDDGDATPLVNDEGDGVHPETIRSIRFDFADYLQPTTTTSSGRPSSSSSPPSTAIQQARHAQKNARLVAELQEAEEIRQAHPFDTAATARVYGLKKQLKSMRLGAPTPPPARTPEHLTVEKATELYGASSYEAMMAKLRENRTKR